LDEDDLTRKSVVLLRMFEKLSRRTTTGLSVVPDKTLLQSPKLKIAKTIVEWLEAQGYSITLNRSHWSGYIKFALSQIPGLFFPQLKNPLLFSRYCSQASFRMPKPKAQRTAKELESIYSRCLRPDLRNLAAKQMLGLSETRLQGLLGE
jgi:hypothetical protein